MTYTLATLNYLYVSCLPDFPQLLSKISISHAIFVCLAKTCTLLKTQFKGASSVELVRTLLSLCPRLINVSHSINITFLHAFVCPGPFTPGDGGHIWFIFAFTAIIPRLELFAKKQNMWRWFLKPLLATTFHVLRKQFQIFSTLNQDPGGLF